MHELPTITETIYRCPGESYDISRSVHLSRLASYYPKCRECVHREAVDAVKVGESSAPASEKPAKPGLQWTEQGVRGVYLNEMNAPLASNLAGALASLLWEQVPLQIREGDECEAAPWRPMGPTVVIGHDERPAAFELVTAAARSLRRMGTQVVDVGLTSRPAFWWAVNHLQAAGGIHVTGSGCDPAGMGCDFVLAGGVPMTSAHRLDELHQKLTEKNQRPHRQSAPQRLFSAVPAYEATLGRHFHALRPLRVAGACASRPVSDSLQRLFSRLAASWIDVPLPVRARSRQSLEDIDHQRVQAAVLDHQAHFGLLIHDDGQTCTVFDEQGNPVAPRAVTFLLAELLLAETPQAAIVAEIPADDVLLPAIDRRHGLCVACDPVPSTIALTLRETQAVMAGGDSGRYWFRESFPQCDALLTLGRLMQALSRSDADFSTLIANLAWVRKPRTTSHSQVALNNTLPGKS